MLVEYPKNYVYSTSYACLPAALSYLVKQIPVLIGARVYNVQRSSGNVGVGMVEQVLHLKLAIDFSDREDHSVHHLSNAAVFAYRPRLQVLTLDRVGEVSHST